MAAHRYWRLQMNGSDFGAAPGTWVGVAELTGIETNGGPNVLVGGTASSPQGYYTGGNFQPDKAFDGNPSTFWLKDSPAFPIVLKYDLGVGITKDIKQIGIATRNDGFPTQGPNSWDWQYSDDDITYTTYFSATGHFTANGQIITSGILPTVVQAGQLAVVGVETPVAANVQIGQVVTIALLEGPPIYAKLGPAFNLPCWQPCTAFGTEAIVIRLN